MTTATLSQVHTSPLKPCASAPLANSSGNLARCSSLRRDGAPGGGLCLKASAPSSLARFIHRLTAPSLFPRASAISDCFQPRSFNSKARKRLPSRQLVAWLDNVFSIVGFVIPMSLDLYARICKNPQTTRLYREWSDQIWLGSKRSSTRLKSLRGIAGLFQRSVYALDASHRISVSKQERPRQRCGHRLILQFHPRFPFRIP